jgi:hypothetical protein
MTKTIAVQELRPLFRGELLTSGEGARYDAGSGSSPTAAR